MIDEKLFVDLRQYILSKTGILYFGRIKQTPKDLMVSCPFHKNGQEQKPSCGIKLHSDEKGGAGTVHCFTCGKTSNIYLMVKDILGNLFNEEEVESLFQLKTLETQSYIQQEKQAPLLTIPKNNIVKESMLRNFRKYHTYLESRGITKEVAEIYDIGYDEVNGHITFPIKNIYNKCIGIGRRSISEKRYIYPPSMIKPLYGLYELPKYLNYVWVVEGPFNLWSLKVWNKTGVALLGTGTSFQYKQLLDINCTGFVLALDGDNAGRNGTRKLIKFLYENKRKCFIALLPDNKDINDLSFNEFKQMSVITPNEWINIYGLN